MYGWIEININFAQGNPAILIIAGRKKSFQKRERERENKQNNNLLIRRKSWMLRGEFFVMRKRIEDLVYGRTIRAALYFTIIVLPEKRQ